MQVNFRLTNENAAVKIVSVG